MNNKDIAEIRKQFKLDNDLLKIADIYNVYIKPIPLLNLSLQFVDFCSLALRTTPQALITSFMLGAKRINRIENVLNCNEIMTAEEDKAVFEEIIKAMIDDEVNSNTFANVYDEINSMLVVEEDTET